MKREQRRPEPAAWRAALENLGPSVVLSVDGAELLSRWRWLRLRWAARHADGAIITSHRPGLLPTLREHRTSPELLENLVAKLLGKEEARALRPDLERLFAEHGGNLRECLRELYDLVAAPESGAAGTNPKHAPTGSRTTT